jgi:hypothetical protein
MIKVIYSFFVGILLAIFVGVGTSLIYEEPPMPETPDSLMYSTSKEPTEAQQIEQRAFEDNMVIRDEQMQAYNRNVSIITLAFAILFLAVAVVYLQKMDVLANSLLLGGIFTLLYSLGRGLASGDDLFKFLIITISLVAAMGLGWWKFVKPQAETAKK